MQFRAFEPDIEVLGVSLGALLAAFDKFPAIAHKFLVEKGLVDKQAGQVKVDLNRWYPQKDWLATFEALYEAVGAKALFAVGKRIPESATFPPAVNDIHSVMRAVDAVYHMHHRKNGRPMFDPASGAMVEGIGHYGYEAMPGERRILSKCENPYPCELDHGILTTMAQRFERHARTDHMSGPCRAKGDDSCTYVVTW